MATITPANLAYKDKDGDLGEVKSLTDTDVTLLNNALQDIEDLKLAYMPGYVKRDFSNVTQDGKDMSIGWDRPDLTAGISTALNEAEQTYTCPSDGWVSFDCNGSNDFTSHLDINDVRISSNYTSTTSYSSYINIFVPVKKDDVCTFRGGGAVSSGKFIFYPCLGV